MRLGEDSLLLLLLIFLILDAAGGQVEASPGPGWKEQTDWSESERVGPPRRGPHFLPGLPTNVSITAGLLVTLPCRVANLKGRSVSWISEQDLQVLAVNGAIFTSDRRLKIRTWREGAVWAWDLVIETTTLEDAGVYQCQVNTRPKLTHLVALDVHLGRAVIPGPAEVYVESGSRLLLTCWVDAPPRPPGPITWLHNHDPIHADGSRGGVSLQEAQEGARATSRLTLTSVTPGDAGNYTCQPEDLSPAHVSVFVLKDEEPRAMHHDEGSSHSLHDLSLLVVALLLLLHMLR
ncbi:protogenin A-like isoform X2 [Panulirus ornatus]|uniref:protogenin A-like isoform X2 n=1 Tax=Panulirus ornatus TaxID=150431 RepID=UPI003A86B576